MRLQLYIAPIVGVSNCSIVQFPTTRRTTFLPPIDSQTDVDSDNKDEDEDDDMPPGSSSIPIRISQTDVDSDNKDEDEDDDMPPGSSSIPIRISQPLCLRVQMGRMVQGEQHTGKGREDDDMDMPPGILVNDGGSVLKMTTTTAAPVTTTTTTPTVSPTIPLHLLEHSTTPSYPLCPSLQLPLLLSPLVFALVFVERSNRAIQGQGRNGGTIMSVAYPSQLPPCSPYRDMSDWNGIGNGDVAGGGVRR
ncbi:hypothetical protein GYMLUDRAFT_252568 [Collybiopsis luxurians FD-317 M1]|uniref:Uncharacterized protein n=1 Tax=Collybiopsis luxurians FD-317 M1 TaxID=944289 RepID=A0A0D0BZS8_9AGAR|nr:hypothetical protein GYMLUDRAFT_252568 [Collybiopsis luxurians FD-317 M1]